MSFVLISSRDGSQGVIPRQAIISGQEDVAICIILGKRHNVTIHEYNNDYGLLDTFAKIHNKKRLKVVIERRAAVVSNQKANVEGITPIGHLTSGIHSTLGIPSTLDIPSTPTIASAPCIPFASGTLSTPVISNSLPAFNLPPSTSDVLPTADTLCTSDTPCIYDTPSCTYGILPSTSSILPSTSDVLPSTSGVLPSTSGVVPSTSGVLPSTSDVLSTYEKEKASKRVRRVCNKPFICKFCNGTKTNMRRHVTAIHKEEPEVKEYLLMNDDNPQKRLKLSQMRRDGNFKYFKENEGIIPARISKHIPPCKADFIACPCCKVLIKKESLFKHMKLSCPNSSSKSSKGMLLQSKVISESVHKVANDTMRTLIFPTIREGPVKEAIRHDFIIIVYGNEMACKYRSHHHIPMIRHRLIRMAKVLIKVKEKNPHVKCFSDILRPHMYDALIEVINDMGEYDKKTGNYSKPTIPTEIGTALKYIIQLQISECIKKEDRKGKTQAENLFHLLKISLPAHVNKTAMESLLHQKRAKKAALPKTSEIETLNQYVIMKRNECFENLNKKFQLLTWTELSKFTLISILIFNRRRPGELERSLLTDLDTLITVHEDSDAYKSMNEQKKAHAKEFSRFLIRGKLARGVPVLLHKSMEECLRLVIKHRREAGVLDDNPYIFGLPQSRTNNIENVVHRHLSATALMRQYSVDCGASNPKYLRATALRKHVATQSISLNLNNEDLQQLQGHLGHEDKIHREYYRQPIVERQLINVRQMLEDIQQPSSQKPSSQEPSSQQTSSQQTSSHPTSPPRSSRDSSRSGTPSAPSTPVTKYTTPVHFTPTTVTSGIQKRKVDDYSESGSEYAPSSSNSEDMVLAATPKRRRLLKLSPGQASVKRTWETPERQAARRLFSHYIEKGTAPSNSEIMESVSDCPELSGRTVPQIRLWLINSSKNRLTKKTWDTPRRHTVRRIFHKHIVGESSSYPSRGTIQQVIDTHQELATLTPRRVQSQIQQQKKKYALASKP